ncbi:transposase, partial [Bacteroides mediterraneensis]|nr:transposase [Bacteroides mediterraneensis]
EVADSGYGSEENYSFMEENGIEAYVKYNFFHKEQRADKYVTNPFKQENLYYNKEKDYYVCPMGQHMKRTGVRHYRCIEPEAVFGQIKYDMGYKRFRHFGKDKATMDFAFFAIAFNIKKNQKMTDKNYQNIRVA